MIAGISGRGEDPSTPFDLGLWTDLPVRDVMGRWRVFLGAIPGYRSAVLAQQVHGTRVLWHEAPATAGWTLVEGADGHATAAPGHLLLVTVADCIPIYIYSPASRSVALLHAGWRGTAGRIVERAIELLRGRGEVDVEKIVIHLGVGICGASYEVGEEVMRAVEKRPDGAGPWNLDLREVLAAQARELGIRDISSSGQCSACSRDRFFSHRGSAGQDGRMVAYVGLLPLPGRDP